MKEVDVKEELIKIKQDVSQLKEENKRLNEKFDQLDIIQFKEELREIRREVREVHEVAKKLNEKVNQVQEDILKVKEEINNNNNICDKKLEINTTNIVYSNEISSIIVKSQNVKNNNNGEVSSSNKSSLSTPIFVEIENKEKNVIENGEKINKDQSEDQDEKMKKDDDANADKKTKNKIETTKESVQIYREIEKDGVLYCEIGMQTMEELEPDVWYFAGGRNVGSQTDLSEEYPPLKPFSKDEKVTIVIINESDTEMTKSDLTESIGHQEIPLSSSTISDEMTSSSDTKSSATQFSPSFEGLIFISGNFEDNETLLIEKNKKQLSSSNSNNSKNKEQEQIKQNPSSAEVILDSKKEENVVEVVKKSTFADKARNGLNKSPNYATKSYPANLNNIGRSNSQGEESSHSSGGGGGGNKKSFSAGTTTSNSGNSSSNPSSLNAGNYRSNIASRFRTAANYRFRTGVINTQQQQQQVVSNKSIKSSPTKFSNTTLSAPPSKSLQLTLSSVSSGQKKNSCCATASANKNTASSSSTQATLNSSQLSEGVKVNSTIKLGVMRSKSMITTSGIKTRGISSAGSGSHNNMRKLENKLSLGHSSGNNNEKKKSDLGINKKNSNEDLGMAHSISFVSLPDKISKRRQSIVDEDGWETVRTRSNRTNKHQNQSKESLTRSISSSSIHSFQSKVGGGGKNQENKSSPSKNSEPSIIIKTNGKIASSNSNTKKIEKPKIEKTNEIKPKPNIKNNNNSKKDDENVIKEKSRQDDKVKVQAKKLSHNRNRNESISDNGDEEQDLQWKTDETDDDDEEIKKKDALLDSAMREEKLLEEELLQVEKDFEEIEKETSDDAMTSENEAAVPSPDLFDALNDSDKEFEYETAFFISVDDMNSKEFGPKESGRIVTLREKLMSPAKKCDSAETLRKHQAKLEKAERNRENLLKSKFNKYVELSDRFGALSETTKKLVEERTELLTRAEERRKRAEEKRNMYLESIRMKAHDEDSKLREIAFINYLGAQNKRHEYIQSTQEIEERLLQKLEERKQKLEDRSTKVTAVIERQQHIKTNWKAKLKKMQEKKRKAEERISREKEEKKKERTEIAQEKARDREERLNAINAAKQAEKEELQKKIQQKQEDTARRHEENIEQIRQKAVELQTPRPQEDSPTVRMCSLCKVIVQSEVTELAHLRGRTHLDSVRKSEKEIESSLSLNCGVENFGIKYITDVPVDKLEKGVHLDKNRAKSLKKHFKKLYLKLYSSGVEFETEDQQKAPKLDKIPGDSSLKSKVAKKFYEIERIIGLFDCNKGTTSLSTNLDRTLRDLRKTINKNEFLKDIFIPQGAFKILQKILESNASDLPLKVKVGACQLITAGVYLNLKNTLYVIQGTCICSIIETLSNRWNELVPDETRWLCTSPTNGNDSILPSDLLLEEITELFFTIINRIPDPINGISSPKFQPIDSEDFKNVLNRTLDIIGYLVTSGVVDRLTVYCGGVRGVIDNQPSVVNLLRLSIDNLTLLVYTLSFCISKKNEMMGNKKQLDNTQYLAALESSELAGAISLSYSILLHQGAPLRPRTLNVEDEVEDGNKKKEEPPPPSKSTIEIVNATLCLINGVSRHNLDTLQSILGSEAVSLQFRHIVSQLLWQIVPYRSEYAMRKLLLELLMAIGNFTVTNPRNQVTIQSGQNPTVLQQICALPKDFFDDAKLSKIFLPTLIAATCGLPENEEILIKQGINAKMLDDFMEINKSNTILQRVFKNLKDKENKTPPSTSSASSTTE